MRGGIWREPRKLPPFLCALFQIGKGAENPCHSPHQQRKTSANFKAKPRTGGRFARGFRTGKRDPGKANMKPKKKKPAVPVKQQEATKSASPTAKPQPLSELEQRARGMALRGMRALRTVANLAAFEGYPDGPQDDGTEEKALLNAGKWGEALRLVSEALWALYPDAGGTMEDVGYWEANEAVGKLEEAEEQAKREVRNARRKARLKIANAGFHPTSAAAALVRAGIMPV